MLEITDMTTPSTIGNVEIISVSRTRREDQSVNIVGIGRIIHAITVICKVSVAVQSQIEILVGVRMIRFCGIKMVHIIGREQGD